MAIPRFGVSVANVRAHYFPSRAAFSSTSTPTEDTVSEIVNAAAADLAGKLAAAGATATSITASASPSAFAWCADYVRLGSAVRVMEAMAGAGAVPAFWRQELKDKRQDLQVTGLSVLGDAPTPGGEYLGARSHVTGHSLETDTESISDSTPRFRRSDEL